MTGRRLGLGCTRTLTPELEKFVSAKVEGGRYGSSGEVVREALHLLEEHDQNRIGRRLESLDRGGHVKRAEARDRLKSKSDQRRKSKA